MEGCDAAEEAVTPRGAEPTMARIPIIAGNWKMHTTRAEGQALVAALTPLILDIPGRQIIVAPPFTALDTVGRAITGTPIRLAAQNLHWEAQGAYTGEVSAAMLRDAGCAAVIIGHSERRQYFGETDESVNRKIGAALRSDLMPIVCVGETLAERDAGSTAAVIERQVRGAFLHMDPDAIARCVVAYEPVWAIGTGRTATPDQAQDVHGLIRRLASTLSTPAVAGGVRILYGGSVKPDNVDALMAQADVDGALVGGASLKAEDFARIVRFAPAG
jgi:triosephosphate isomerase